LFMGVYVAVDPASRISAAKDVQREQDVLLIAQAMKDYMLDNKGDIPISGDITTSKKVLCDTSISLTCSGDTEDCLVIDTTTDFLDSYLPTLPVDPEKTNSADTGYYVQNVGDQVIVGSCDYEDEAITKNPRIVDTTEAAAPTCTGYEYEGYCWYLASTANMSCDQVCAENELVCVSGITYGPDTTCELNKGISGSTCYSGAYCYVADGYAHSPGVLTIAPGMDICLYDTATPAYNCSESATSGYKISCVCEAA